MSVYERQAPRSAEANGGPCNDEGLCHRRAVIALARVLVYSTGLASAALAGDNQPPANRSNIGAITIEVDPRVELMAIVFRLAGNPEYRQCRIPSYVTDTERYFGDFDHHPAVAMATRLRNTRRMSCDGPMSLALHIDPDLRPLKSFEQWPWGLDGRWKKDETREFLEKLRQFAAETRFDQFFRAHRPMYEKGLGSCRAIMVQHDLPS